MGRRTRGRKLPKGCTRLLERLQLGRWKAGLPGRGPRLPTGPKLPGMLRWHARPCALLLLKLPGSRLPLQLRAASEERLL